MTTLQSLRHAALASNKKVLVLDHTILSARYLHVGGVEATQARRLGGSIIELQQQNATSKYRKLMLESSALQMLFLYVGLIDSAGLVRLKTVGIIGLCNFASVGSQTRQQELLKSLYNGIWRGDIARQEGLDRYGCRVMAI